MNLGLYLYQGRRWLLAAVLPALLAGILAYGWTARQPKTYRATATLYVLPQQTTSLLPSTSDVGVFQSIPTYTSMIQSPVVARAADAALQASYPGYRVEKHKLRVDGGWTTAAGIVMQNTSLLNIAVDDTVPQRAADAANAVGNAFIRTITNIQKSRFQGGQNAIQQELNVQQENIKLVNQKIANYRGGEAGLNNLRAELAGYQSLFQTLQASSEQYNLVKQSALHGVKVFSQAQAPKGFVGPYPSRTALIVAVLIFLLGSAGIFAYQYFDDRPRTPEEIEEIVGAPVLGTVQEFTRGRYTEPITGKQSSSVHAEAYRAIRTNVQFLNVDDPPRVLVITSTFPAEGKTTTAVNLATVFAEAGSNVTLLDADLRRPSLHRVFSLPRVTGLTSLLVGTEELNGHTASRTETTNLGLVASGPLPPRPADLLGSTRMKEIVRHLDEEADLVVVDSPPVLAVTDAAILSTMADGVILVVDPGKTKRRELKRARESIEAVGGKVLGVVINRLSKHGSGYYYYYYQQYYSYGYEYGAGRKGGGKSDRGAAAGSPDAASAAKA